MRRSLFPQHLVIPVMTVARLATAQAPSIFCVQDPEAKVGADCKITARQGTEPLIIRIDSGGKPLAGAKVTVDGPQTLRAIVPLSDASGIAVYTWDGAVPPAGVTFDLKAEHEHWVIKRKLAIQPRQSASFEPSVIGFKSTDEPLGTWFAGHQLGTPIRVLLKGIPDENCSKGVVVFKPLGEGAATPDSARGQLQNNQCVAESLWKLGATVGEQRMRIFAADDPSRTVMVKAESRHTPWLAAGLAYAYDTKYFRFSRKSTTVEVKKKNDSVDSTSTTTQSSPSADSVPRGFTFSPIIGVNTPIRTSWPNVRVSLSADPRKLDTEWFAGLSIPQLWRGILAEDTDVDLQFIVHLERRNVVTNSDVCFKTPMSCTSDQRTRPVGVGVAVQFNGGGFLSTVTGLLFKQ